MRIGSLLREAVMSALAARASSALVMVVAAAMCLAAILTAGQAEASRSTIHDQLTSDTSRLLTVSALRGAGFITPATVGVIQGLDSTDVVLARTPATDVVNAATGPGGPVVPLWEVHGDLDSAVTLLSGRWPQPGEALISETARTTFGLAGPAGAAQLSEGRQIPIVGTFRAAPAFTVLDAGILAVSRPGTPLASVDVLATSLADVEAAQAGTLDVLAPSGPQQVSVDSQLGAARTAMELDAQLAETSRTLLITVLGIGLLLVCAVVLADVLIRARDLGRRRTLGITRTDLVAMVSLRAGAAAVPGIVVAVGVTLALGKDIVDVSPLVALPIGLLTLDAVLLAAIPPALVAAFRDPVRVMRVA